MCLSTLRETYKGRGKTIVAYKEFKIVAGAIVNKIRPIPEPWFVGVEKKVENRVVIKGGYCSLRGLFKYTAGFHAYATRPTEKQRWGKVWGRVQLRGVHTKGTQGNRITYVARYCKILELL